jgi:hypothetical protein
MAEPERRAEERDDGHGIHLPAPSYLPLVLSFGVALSLGGLVPDSRLARLSLVSLGLTIAAIAAFMWIRDAIVEYRHLPD